MLFAKIGSTYTSSEFPEEFSNMLYYSENVELGEFSYKSTFSLKYVLTGYERYSVEGRELTIKPQQYLLVNNSSKVITLPAAGRAISIFIDPNTLLDVERLLNNSTENLLDNYDQISQTPFQLHEKIYNKENVRINNLLKKVVTQLHSGTLENEYEIDTSFFFQLSEAIISDQKIHSNRLGNLNGIKKPTIQEQYKRLLFGYEYLNDNWDKPFSLKETASISMLSPFHFHRLFRLCFSMTPYQFHIKNQMEKALDLLMKNKHAISEISCILGFNSTTSFGRTFKNYFGIPPSQYLKL